VQYQSNEQEDALKQLISAYDISDMDSVDSELALSASIYGLGICLLYADESARPKAASIDPQCAFAVYSDRADAAPLAGILIEDIKRRDGAKKRYVSLYTKENTCTLLLSCDENAGGGISLISEEPAPHFFGQVPLIEFWNNSDERGDFEDEILETAQTAAMLRGLVPDEILLSIIPFVDDAQSALSQLIEQQES
jgi:SPP1 family phage portal protein